MVYRQQCVHCTRTFTNRRAWGRHVTSREHSRALHEGRRRALGITQHALNEAAAAGQSLQFAIGGNLYLAHPGGLVQNVRANPLEQRGVAPRRNDNAARFMQEQFRRAATEILQQRREEDEAAEDARIQREEEDLAEARLVTAPNRGALFAAEEAEIAGELPPQLTPQQVATRLLAQHHANEDAALHVAALQEEHDLRIQREENLKAEGDRAFKSLTEEELDDVLAEAKAAKDQKRAAAAAATRARIATEHARIDAEEKAAAAANTLQSALESAIPADLRSFQARPGWLLLHQEHPKVLTRGLRAFQRVQWNRNVLHGARYFRNPHALPLAQATRFLGKMAHLDTASIRDHYNRGVALGWFPSEEEESESLPERKEPTPPASPLTSPHQIPILAPARDDDSDSGYHESVYSSNAEAQWLRRLEYQQQSSLSLSAQQPPAQQQAPPPPPDQQMRRNDSGLGPAIFRHQRNVFRRSVLQPQPQQPQPLYAIPSQALRSEINHYLGNYSFSLGLQYMRDHPYRIAAFWNLFHARFHEISAQFSDPRQQFEKFRCMFDRLTDADLHRLADPTQPLPPRE